MSDVVAVDVGGTRIRVARSDASAVHTVATPDRVDDVAHLVTELISSVSRRPKAIGIACAGLVDHRAGVVRWTPHAEGSDLGFGAIMQERYGVEAWVDNDANAAALAEARTGAGIGYRMVLMITVGTGIGAGLVIDGVVEHGRGHLGEVGHMTVADSPACVCGRTGCWEELAAGRALDRAAAGLEPGADGARLVAMAADGDSSAQAALDEMTGWLAVGIENLVLALDPDVVVLGGIVPAIGSALFDPLQARLGQARGPLAIIGVPPVSIAAHGDRAGLEGAMIGAMEKVT